MKCVGPSTEGVETEVFGRVNDPLRATVGVQRGQIEAADGGTLVLEDIEESPPAVQERLLRLLQRGEFERVGEKRARFVDVRIVATTAGALDEKAGDGSFRAELFYLLNGTAIEIPPLRRRGEDIVPLAQEFVRGFAHKSRRKVPELAPAAQQALTNYAWPGNAAELRNLIERAVMRSAGGRIEVSDFPPEVAANAVSVPRLGGDFSLKEIEREHIRRVLAQTANAAEAARTLGISLPTLWRKRQELDHHR